jgi:hypothetical protein
LARFHKPAKQDNLEDIGGEGKGEGELSSAARRKLIKNHSTHPAA